MSETPALPDIHNEPERELGSWALLNTLSLTVGAAACAVFGVTGYYITTNGYEVTGAVILVSSIMLGCHIGELARTAYLKRRGGH
ncbi:hypothetical protein [Aquisalimonas asiatica]|uniref:Uncharacterized protein n=1 Tax=Aquisalimonas asiatica TaxID=406100 RepID=A0A1H8Q8N8_9GAMM|nr:hypothetical protein [Aquisalimonas asiatica]SEO50331.1 hypothetical protein SAMN04488052_101410 [Aquisalimonas asiatica]